jgi:hypothetical protein
MQLYRPIKLLLSLYYSQSNAFFARTLSANTLTKRNLVLSATPSPGYGQNAPYATNETPFIVMLDIDDTITTDIPFSSRFDAYFPSKDIGLNAYLRPSMLEFIRRLARQNVKFGFITNRSGPFGHSIIDFLRYALARGCPSCSKCIGPVPEYYQAMVGRVVEENPGKTGGIQGTLGDGMCQLQLRSVGPTRL